jgi:glycosyltransferase involved in cell wall biosynthesis
MRVLHVAALPFPSPQGTQALLHAMLMAHAQAGHEAHLLCYPGPALHVPYAIHRCGRERQLSQRSGPSLQKLALDAQLALRLPRVIKLLRPHFIVAHHVEAALIARALRIPAWFYAHTDLGAELPTYFRHHQLALRLAGARVDRYLSQHMPTLAVSPLLAARMKGSCIPIPWSIAAPITPEERGAARAHFGFRNQRVALYAGNLDRYQGIEALLRLKAQLLIATESPIRGFSRPNVRFAPLANETDRRRAYAAADVALVPRAVPGGIPIKLFDALARGVPVVAAKRALAGYPLEPFCTIVAAESRGRSARELANDWGRAIETAQPQRDARPYLREAHDPVRFAKALSDLSSLRDAAPA